MARTEDNRLETETIIRWDDLGEMATLWTASARVKREWESFGFQVQGDKAGWRAECPVDRISYKMLKKA